MSTSREVDNLRSETKAGVISRCTVDGGNLTIAYFLECVVLSPSLYMLIQLISSISVNSGF